MLINRGVLAARKQPVIMSTLEILQAVLRIGIYSSTIKNSKRATAAIEFVKNSVFIVSDKSEKDLIEEKGGQSWIIPLGIILSGLGLGLFLDVFG